MKFSKDSKALAIAAIGAAAALFTVVSENINAGQRYYDGYRSYGYDRGYARPAPPGYQYYAPGRQNPMQGYRQPAYNAAPPDKPARSNDTGSETSSVNITGMRFTPATIRVKAGETVTWMNNENMPHTVTSQNSGVLASERLGRGSLFTHTFEQPGTYTYYCALHPSMTGKVIVE